MRELTKNEAENILKSEASKSKNDKWVKHSKNITKFNKRYFNILKLLKYLSNYDFLIIGYLLHIRNHNLQNVYRNVRGLHL